jgi:glycosyltransferase involved in cell wall biosynthesis
MVRVLAVLPIYHRNEETIASLTSWKITDLKGIDLHMCLAVNGADDELMGFLDRYCVGEVEGLPKGMTENPSLYYHPDNPGKGVSVNNAVLAEEKRTSEIRGKVDFILSFDSDLIISDPSWLQILIRDYRRANDFYPTVAISSDQTGNCCHVPEEPEHKEGLIFAKENQGIAGGCLLVSHFFWKKVKGYKAHRVYGSDDGHFMLDAHNDGNKVCISETCSLFHPFPSDADYQSWKVRACRDELGEEEKGGFYAKKPF